MGYTGLNGCGDGGGGGVNITPGVSVRSFKMSMRVCGPKLSTCCTVISVWGILQLLVMALCFYMR